MRPAPRTAVLAVLLGAAVGVVAAGYLGAVHLLEHLVWEGSEPRLPGAPVLTVPLVCVAGGVLVGLLRRREDRSLPHDLDDALLEVERAAVPEDPDHDPERPDPRPLPSVDHLVRSALLGVVSLGFGASLGPEAPLLVITVGFAQRMARILRLSRREAAYISASGALAGLFGGPLGAMVLPVEGSGRGASGDEVRLLPYGLLASVSGLVALLAVLPGEAGGRYVLPSAGVETGRDLAVALAWAALAALPATAAGLAVMGVAGPSRRFAERALASPVARAAAGGLVLGVCGVVAPLVLFSGQHQAQDLVDGIGSWSVLGLLGLAAVKLLATTACQATGWFGGQIFPAVFAGMTLGAAFATAVPAAPAGAVVAAGAGAATAALLRRPLASVLLMLFYFPPETLLALAVGAAVATAVVQALGDRLPHAPGLLDSH